jgi:subtilisin family serine protease
MTSARPVDAWLDRGRRASPRFASLVEADCTVTSPATARDVLAVTSYVVSPTLGSLAPSSGRGPDRRGASVQVLAAPGETITTCAAGPGTSSHYAPDAGTSLAAAHVTGAIAVMLEAEPALSRADVLDRLRRTARTDADTSAGPASGWGAGKLDLCAAVGCAAVGVP